MTIDTTAVHEEMPPDGMDFPVTVGWTQAAIAVNSVLQLSSPMVLKLQIESHGPLTIDFRHHAFDWSTSLDDFPVDAVHTGLETAPTDADSPPFFELPGKDLDGLLWEMGINSFGGAAAFWLKPGARYKLSRWPNLTKHSHSMRQMHMMAMLGNAYLSASELAAHAGVEESEANRLINALSLMRILNYSLETAAPAVAQIPVAKRQSLFGRLRARLGR
jgi:hypothetical protein